MVEELTAALITPAVGWHERWLDAHHEWGPGLHEDGFGIDPSDEVETPNGFAAWVDLLLASDNPAEADRRHMLPCRYRWISEGDRVVGGIALRYGSSDFVRRNGHIGYGIRPSARRRGLATWALGRMLDEARGLDLDRVLLVCEADNEPSAATIEHNGGVVEASTDAAIRRYWIDL